MAVSDAEKIRKAEEIYYRRKNGIKATPQVVPKKGFFKGLLIKVIYILLIIGCIYAYNNKDYLLSEQFSKDIQKIMSIKIDFNEIWNNIINKNKKEDSPKVVNENIEQNITEESESNSENVANAQDSEELSLNDEIKNKYSFIKPLDGTITSDFGNRVSEYENVTPNHTGIDISGEVGKVIVSSIQGVVTQVSDKGDYGNHLKISNGEITTLYAHCNKIYVSEGDEIKQGQEIAEVGNTGNTTGSHLHFEIRKGEEYINPTDIIDF